MTSINSFQAIPQQKTAFNNNKNEKDKKTHSGATAASFFIPGAGQLIKGDTSKGIAFLAVYISTWIASLFFSVASSGHTIIGENSNRLGSMLKSLKNHCSALPDNTKLAVGIGLLALNLGTIVVSTVDARKYVPSEKT